MTASDDLKSSIVLFGGLSSYTFVTLSQLLEHRFAVHAVVLHAYRPAPDLLKSGEFPVSAARLAPIVELCQRKNIPIEFFTGDEVLLLRFLDQISAGYFVLSCYPKRLSTTIIDKAQYECINIHPSRLPRYRGINPIFWQIRNSESDTGITLHRVSDTIDSGDIIDSRYVSYGRGSRLAEIHNKLISTAVSSLQTLIDGAPEQPKVYEQDHTQLTVHLSPKDSDYTLQSFSDKAMTAYNLVRAYSGTDVPLRVACDSRLYEVRDAIEVQDTWQRQQVFPDSTAAWINFMDGSVKFQIVNMPHIN